MIDAAAFLRSICANPADDCPRLQYADWLEERGDPRGELIRVQCALAAWPCECDSEERVYYPECRCDEKAALQRRERELLAAHSNLWLFLLPPNAPPIRTYGTPTFRRGFVARVELPTAAFLEHAAALFAAAPIEEVRLNDREPIGSGWFSALVADVGYTQRPRGFASSGRQHRLAFEMVARAGIPDPIFRLLPGLNGHRDWQAFESPWDALSVAAVAYGRAAAGLPPLPRPAPSPA